MKIKLGLSKDLPGLEISKIYPELRLQNIINYEPWKSNGGTSDLEYRNSYYEIWQYNSDCYSTFYELESNKDLVKNICCLAYFTGEYQKKDFLQGFSMDVFKIIYYLTDFYQNTLFTTWITVKYWHLIQLTTLSSLNT